MKNRIKIMTVFGTRPEAIKMAPVVKELKKHADIFDTIVAVTAQQRQMLDQVLSIFSIQPDYDLNIMKDRQTLFDITTASLIGLGDIMEEAKPDMVLVHGDTSTSFVASLAAFYKQIPIGHVEAGLRTNNKHSPFPEEVNRQLTGVLADLHFSPTQMAAENLLRENKKRESILITGNTSIDALNTTISDSYQHDILTKVGDDRLILLTAHRRENLGLPMRSIFKAVKRLVKGFPDVQVVFPVHLNPVVREMAEEILANDSRIHLIEPLGAIDFHNIASRSFLILTDSGGVQEEAPSLGVPVLVLRDTTERPEGIEAGTLKLVGTNEQDIFDAAYKLLTDESAYQLMAKARNPYGDGTASVQIVQALVEYFNQ